MPQPQETPNLNLDDKCKIKLTNDSEEIEIAAKDLEVLEELGKGGYGVVDKMRHRQSGIIMAVKRISSSINEESQKRMLTELDACKRSDCCPQVVEGLNFMKEDMNLIHRDVKPSNILLNRHGQVKICDFGISGHLTNSLAKTVAAGCKFYMPPERIDGDMKGSYDVRADVWSLGITLVEIATGNYPYDIWVTPFQQLNQVLNQPAPRLPSDGSFTPECQHFVQRCLEKDPLQRPKYPELLAMPFLNSARNEKQFSMAKFMVEVSF
ncbi:kinase domain protein [Ancylostoma duodenale]|uniref:mitogen-activated protein kinase kinase n=1 Tax=Ancylostoma duodenale TaxID=51022 RepID=A0A0C2D7N8_9BILA|nr:kinase domain protein [Ancylostoma duodenale]